MAIKNVIITTTINQPTPEIRKFDNMPDWELIVTGDRKSPEYKLEHGTFVSWAQQEADYPALCKLIGPDNTMRGRMIALLEAHKRNPGLVAMIDDDCTPYGDWPGEIYVGSKSSRPYIPAGLCFNVGKRAYGLPSRGLPPQLWGAPLFPNVRMLTIDVLLQSNPCDGQADVDAMFRLNGELDNGFSAIQDPVWSNGFSIINPMHTIISGSVLKDYVGEIPFIGHVCDIWAGYLFQAWHPKSTIYGPSNCRHWQDRSYASVLSELEDEIYSYRYGLDFLRGLQEHGPDQLEKISCLPLKAIEAINCYRSYFE